ncbi:MAG TPA: alpha/beta hydrolase [Armatimonadota bacterium]|jgi:acetyl esterase/lipase
MFVKILGLALEAGLFAFAATAAAGTATAAPPREVPLWPNGAPGAKGKAEADRPVLWIHEAPAAKANGAAIVICPGGGYEGLALDHEGHEVAEWFNTFGVTAAVLRYRLGAQYHHPIPLMDARRAVRTLRANAKAWGLDPKRIGIMGFSAGGHLAATAATQFEPGSADATDPVERASSRPDFAILCYPVITMTDPFTHAGSRLHLLGEQPSPALVNALSAEKRVTKDTPPVFLFHTSNDDTVPVENSLMFFTALRAVGAPVEMHIYRDGPHGIGMNRLPSAATWPGLARDWMQHLGLLG